MVRTRIDRQDDEWLEEVGLPIFRCMADMCRGGLQIE
jgi:hypothetical protein